MKTTDVPRWLYVLMLTCTVVGLGTLAGEGMVWAVMGTPSKQAIEQKLRIEELRAEVIAIRAAIYRAEVERPHVHQTAPSPVIPVAFDERIPPTSLPEK